MNSELALNATKALVEVKDEYQKVIEELTAKDLSLPDTKEDEADVKLFIEKRVTRVIGAQVAWLDEFTPNYKEDKP